MRKSPDDEKMEVAARRMMRQGRDDEDIAAQTGLSMIRILSLRAGAAVEDSPPRRKPAGGGTQVAD